MKVESKNKKPKWSKPKLIILTRGKPEERVLAVCKGAEVTVEITTQANGCATDIPCQDFKCLALGPS